MAAHVSASPMRSFAPYLPENIGGRWLGRTQTVADVCGARRKSCRARSWVPRAAGREAET